MLLAGAALGLHVGAPARSPVASRAAVTLQAPVAEELTFEERCRRAGVDPKGVPAEPTLIALSVAWRNAICAAALGSLLRPVGFGS